MICFDLKVLVLKANLTERLWVILSLVTFI